MAICGYRTGVIWDATRSNWESNEDRPIAWSAWYPGEDLKKAERSPAQFFELGNVIWEAMLASREKFPVVLLSHGTGGTAESLGWLARGLAEEGYIVLDANHHCNTGLERYRTEGFLCWWERATDLSVLLSEIGSKGFFANRLDLSQVAAVGFSLGGHTVLALSGAKTSLDEFDVWRMASGITQHGPKESPGVADSIPTLMATSDAFRVSWERHRNDYSDVRIKSVVAIAPAPPIRSFVATSLNELQLPILILTGGADEEAPSEHCADWLVSQNEKFRVHRLGAHVGHYTFLDLPSDKSLIGRADIFTDHESVDRRKVHEQALGFVSQNLRTTVSKCEA